MNIITENDKSALVDTIKYTTDVMVVLISKIEEQDEEILLLKKKIQDMESKLLNVDFKIKNNIKLKKIPETEIISENDSTKTESLSDYEEEKKSRKDDLDITSLDESEIKNIKKEKSKINTNLFIDNNIKKRDKINQQEEKDKNKIETNVVNVVRRRGNNFIRRF